MTSEEFLRAVWPSEGFYVLAKPFVIPGTKITTYTHKVFEDISDAVAFVDKIKDRDNVFFCIHSLREHRIWDASKRDYKTGELGAWAVRVQQNMLASRAFFFDLDVGHQDHKYDSRDEAVLDLRRFCKEAGLPKPLIASSGGGVHVYWLISDAMPSEEWRKEAAKLRALARHYGLKADPARTTDTSSVLRVVGTYNMKTNEKRPVVALTPATIYPTGQFLKTVADAVVRSGVTLKELPSFKQDDDLGLGSNLSEEIFSGPPVSMKSLILACKQVQRLAKLRGKVSEPEWYHSINLVRFTDNGRANAHKISDQHPDYDAATTDRKLDQLESKNIKPTSCAKLAEVCGDELCEGCPFMGKVKGPLLAARFKDVAPAPVVQHLIGSITQQVALPDPPKPFARLSSGKIAMVAKNKDGDEINTVILNHDLFPVRRIANEQRETEQLMWRVILPPHNRQRDFVIDSDALYDGRKFATAMVNRGIYATRENLPHLQGYMIAYIAELQKLAEAEAQHNHLGWMDEDKTGFVLPDRIIMSDGTAKTASLSKGAAQVAQHVNKRGTLQRQVELLQFYNHPAYVGHQFMIGAALAAPFYYATGHHGVVVAAWGDPGASKSTALYTAAALWGNPDLYTINGTNSGATVRARNERITTLANLPVCVDEITKMHPEELTDLAMNISQPGGRIRLETDGTEKSGNGGIKSTIMLATSNRSLHAALSTDGEHATAGSMRVFELGFRRTSVHTKPEADAFLREMKANYGWIGETLMHHIIPHRVRIEARICQVMAEIDTEAKIQSSERFWSAVVAVVIVMLEEAKALNLINYDITYMRDWLVHKQIPHMRSVVSDVYTSPLGVFTDFLQQNSGDIMVTHGPFQGSNMVSIAVTPRGQLIGHYNVDEKVLWVLKKGFRDYCTRTGHNFHKILEELHEPRAMPDGSYRRVVTNRSLKKVLGAGTEYAKAQAWCFQIDMTHPELADAVPTPAPQHKKPDLKIVS